MFLDHFRLLGVGNLSYRLRSGEVFQARAKTYDVNAIEEVWLLHVYSPLGFEIQPNDTVVDVGAHIGSFTVYAARQASAGRVFAFEPAADNFACLTTNIAANHLNNVTATNAAVAGSSGKRSLFMQSGDHVGHSLYPLGPGVEEIRVETLSLEQFLADHGVDRVNFLKLDCEGAEFEILGTAPDSLLARVDKISMEVHPGEGRDPESLQGLLRSKGFDVSRDGGQMHAIRRLRV